MRVTVLYFAVLRDLVGKAEATLELPAQVRSVGDLVRHLEEVEPALRGRMPHVRVARNEAFAKDGEPIADGDVIALIPPVAGGS